MWTESDLKGMGRAIGCMAGLVLIVACVVVFFVGRCSNRLHIRVWTEEPAKEAKP